MARHRLSSYFVASVVAALSTAAGPLAAQLVRTVLVSPHPTNASISGTRLLAAVAGIQNPNANRRFLVKVEPGIYALGINRLQMRSFVDIEGSGQQATIVQGQGNPNGDLLHGVVIGANDTELRNLQIRAVGNSSRPYAIALLVPPLNSMGIFDVTVAAAGGTVTEGVGIRSASPRIERLTVNIFSASFGGPSYGIAATGSTPALVTLRNVVLNVFTALGATGYGVFVDDNAGVLELRDSIVNVTGGVGAYGFYRNGLGSVAVRTEILGSTLIASGGTNETAAVFFGEPGELVISNSQLRASGGAANFGVLNRDFQPRLRVDASQIEATTATVANFLDVSIGASRLSGGPVTNGVRCAGVYDETSTFFPGPLCP